MKSLIIAILLCSLLFAASYSEYPWNDLEFSLSRNPDLCKSSPGNGVCLPLILNNYVNGFDFQFEYPVPAWQPHPEGWNWDFADGKYTAMGIPGAWVSTSYPANYTDFDYEAELRRSGCPGCPFGLIVRGEPTPLGAGNRWNSGYGFYITQSGYYGIFKYVGGKVITMQDWETNAEINQGEVAWNTLQIKAVGDKIEFSINTSANLLSSGAEVAYPSGKVGIIMFTKSDSIGDQLWVDWAKLTPLPP